MIKCFSSNITHYKLIRRTVRCSVSRAAALFIFVLTVGALTACNTASPTPDPDGPVLIGFDALPKSLATMPPTPTLSAEQIKATLDNRKPTNTLPPATYTATPTPIAGIFMGESTFSVGSLLPTGTRQVAIVTLAPGPGTRSPANNQPTAVGDSGNTSGNTSDNNSAPVNSNPGNCPQPVAGPFVKSAGNGGISQRLGCPTGPAFKANMVIQPFQNGIMLWRDTKEIYIVSTAAGNNNFWRVGDTWNDTLPANDPSLQPPSGLLQPVRGFGYAWRNNQTFRNALGWALSGEQPYESTWQNFEHGWMMTLNNGSVLALVPSDGPPPTTGTHFGVLPQ